MNIIKKFVGINRRYSNLLVRKYPVFFYSPSYQNALLERINFSIEEGDYRKVLEAGGIDRPLLSKGNGYSYDGLDVESRDKCYEIYDNFIIQSIEDEIDGKYDLIISITLLEHVPNNVSSFNSIYLSLCPGGQTHHYIPSKWHPYAIALRIVGPALQKRLIPIFRPGTEDVTGYPAYFDNCSVPSIMKLLEKRGFIDINIRAFYRANDYFSFFVPLFLLVTLFENICKKLNLEIFASGFVVSASKRAVVV